MRAPTEGRLDECRRLNDEVQTIGRNANSDNAAMLVQSQRVCVLLEAGQTEEALILCEHEFPPGEIPSRLAVDDQATRQNRTDHRSERVARSARVDRLHRHL